LLDVYLEGVGGLDVIDIEVVNSELSKAVEVKKSKRDTEIVSAESFKPVAIQRRVKNAFYSKCPVIPTNPSDITLDLVRSYVDDGRVELWWRVPGFISWFTTPEAIASRLNYAMQLRMDTIVEILEDDTGLFSAKDKLAAGAEIDKIAKTLMDASSAIEGKIDSESLEAKIKREYEKMKGEKDVLVREKRLHSIKKPVGPDIT
jgi:hypothetical protein